MLNLAMPTGVSLDSTTAVASDIFSGKTAYNGERERITGTYSFPSVNVTAGNMLSGTSAINSSGSVVNGTMANNGSISATLNPGGSKSYSAGYYSGGTITCNSASSSIKHTNVNIATGDSYQTTISGYAPGTIVGITGMWRNGGDSNPPLSISTSGNSITITWNGNGFINVSFSVAYI